MLKRFGVAMAFTIPIVALACFEIATWTPPVHAVHAPGAIAVKAYFAGSRQMIGPYGQPEPTTSLYQLGCELLRGMAPLCTPAITAQMWPGVVQKPHTLYVPLVSGGVPSSNPSGWNVEYDIKNRTLLIHTYESQPLLVIQRAYETPGAAMQPRIDLLVVATDAISAGGITVTEDTRTERLLGDQAAETSTLGLVTIT